MKAAIHARYSDELQRDESIEDQIRICRERAEKEGWITEIHIGLKGTMGQLYLKDLADKTRRGLAGLGGSQQVGRRQFLRL